MIFEDNTLQWPWTSKYLFFSFIQKELGRVEFLFKYLDAVIMIIDMSSAVLTNYMHLYRKHFCTWLPLQVTYTERGGGGGGGGAILPVD